MPITKQIAVTLKHRDELWHMTLTNTDGTPVRCRVNGKCQTWKTRPDAFKLPVKSGLYTCFHISDDVTQNHGDMWATPTLWPVERALLLGEVTA